MLGWMWAGKGRDTAHELAGDGELKFAAAR
jgi:hypothetical protein